MREATGNSLLTMMMTSIIAIMMVFFVGSLSYSKSFRIKNYIIGEIEENKGWTSTVNTNVEQYLKDAGYNIRKGDYNCSKFTDYTNNCTAVNNQSQYDYCVYECTGTYRYYKVVTFMKFEFPVIGDILKFTVKGETKSFNNFN